MNGASKHMGDVDISDQLRGNYQFDHCIKNRKWWWSLLYWGLGVILTNICIAYTIFNEEEGVSQKIYYRSLIFRKQLRFTG